MSVYIKGMSKELCKMLLNVGDDYEIIEVEEPHGDLIDNEDVGEVLEMLEKYEDIDKDTLDIVMSMLWKIPTVIEAED